jgi:hypothetical protein
MEIDAIVIEKGYKVKRFFMYNTSKFLVYKNNDEHLLVDSSRDLEIVLNLIAQGKELNEIESNEPFCRIGTSYIG